MTEIVLGIDLGTTNSVANIWNKNTHITIKNNCIYLNEEGKIISDHITGKLIL